MDLYNAKTRQREDINDPEALQDAIRNKTHSFEVGQEIPAVNPYGQKVWIKSDEAHEKAALGYTFPTKNEEEVERFVESHSGPLSAIGVGMAQAADELLLGLPELIYEKTASPLEVAKKEALKKEHGLANALGGTAGFIGSMFYGPGARLFKGASKVGDAVNRAVAEKLSAATRGEISKRVLNQTAQKIAARTAGMGVEGAVISAPHAITEAALGHPQEAAEHLLGGIGLGALIGGGFGLGTGLAGEALQLGKRVYNDKLKWSQERGATIKRIARQMARVWTGVPEEKFEYYLNDMERVNSARPAEEIFDDINQAVGGFRTQVEGLKNVVKEKETELAQAYKNSRRDLAQVTTPQIVADETALALERLKSTAGALSGEADEILAAIPGGMDVDDLISIVRSARKTHVPVMVGEKAKTVARKLDALEADLQALKKPAKLTPAEKKNLGIFAEHQTEKLDYPTVRDIIQQVRDDIDWRPVSPEFNTRLNKANKSFTERVSDMVKKDSPQYAAKVKELSKLATIHEKMIAKGFGDPTRSAAIFDTMIKKGAAIDGQLLAEFDAVAGTKLLKSLKGVRGAKTLLEKSARENMSRVLNLDLWREVRNLKRQLKRAEQIYEPISALTPERIQAAMKNLDRKNPNILTQRAFEELDRLTGRKFTQEITDRNVLDSFFKEDKAGSRKVGLSTAVTSGLGSLIGLNVAGPVGLIGGAVTGATLDLYGGQILKNLVDRNPSVAGLLFVEKAMKQNAQKLDSIPNWLVDWAQKKKPTQYKSDTAAIGALWRVLETDKSEERHGSHKGLSESVLKLSEINEKLADLLSNPETMQDHLARITEGLFEGGAPEIAQSFIMASQELLQYLYDALPKPPRPSSPFERPMKWKPPDYQVFAFAQKLQVLENPFMVLDALQDGSLTKNHVQTLAAIFPHIYQEIRGKFAEVATSGVTIPLDYNQRVKLSLLLNMPLDASLTPENIKYLQSTFAQDQAQEEGNKTQGAFHPQINTRYPRGLQTQSQQLLEVR